MSETFFFEADNFFYAIYELESLAIRSNWMILERFEPKKSTKVALCAPGRPFKVAPGAFFGSFATDTSDSVPFASVTLLTVCHLSGKVKTPRHPAGNAPGATLIGRPGAHNATLVDFLGSNRSRIIQFERYASD